MAKTSLKVISFTYYSTTHVYSCWKIDSYDSNEYELLPCAISCVWPQIQTWSKWIITSSWHYIIQTVGNLPEREREIRDCLDISEGQAASSLSVYKTSAKWTWGLYWLWL
mgnify:CR=1 FL=1